MKVNSIDIRSITVPEILNSFTPCNGGITPHSRIQSPRVLRSTHRSFLSGLASLLPFRPRIAPSFQASHRSFPSSSRIAPSLQAHTSLLPFRLTHPSFPSVHPSLLPFTS